MAPKKRWIASQLWGDLSRGCFYVHINLESSYLALFLTVNQNILTDLFNRTEEDCLFIKFCPKWGEQKALQSNSGVQALRERKPNLQQNFPLSNLFLKTFIHSFIHSLTGQRGAEGEGKCQADSPPSVEPAAGLNLATLRSQLERKPRVRWAMG